MKDDPIRPFPASGGQAQAAASPAGGGLDLRAAVRKARIEEAERSGVAAELRGAEIARLEMLQETLQPVFADLPRDAELFDVGLIPGEKPRLFVDMVAFVEMARDRRTYRFIQETRSGRLLIAEGDKADALAEAVTAYLGRRLVERERALAQGEAAAPAPVALPAEPIPAAQAVEEPLVDRRRRYSGSDMLFSAIVGMMAGAALMLLAMLWKARGLELLSGLKLLP
ncbi:hypothetical protein [uncultured Alsobacter sp.]|uniref:hypothetical protein n=1 Tax=uncultured Alsobacter sp. TaxID=1748258 RepID=UPI0025FDE35A|nr:hypothetical protein [uncultured Alsobacter sp.]